MPQRSTRIPSLLAALLVVAPEFAAAQTIVDPTPPWQGVGPNGAQITVIAPDPLDASSIHLGSVGGNVFKTTDGGTSWSALGNGLLATTVAEIELPATGDGALYARSNDQVYAWLPEEDLWVPRPIPGSPRLYGIELGRSSDDLGVLYALTSNGNLGGCCSLWTSDNEGLTWSEKPSGFFGQSLAVLDTDPATLIVGGSRIFRSVDGGNTWSEAIGPPNVLPGVRRVFADPVDPATVYALARPLDLEAIAFTGDGLLKSVDAGATWFATGDGLPEGDGSQFSTTLTINPANPNEILHSNEYAASFRSTDGGASFTPFETPAEQLTDFQARLFAYLATGTLVGATRSSSDRPLAYAPAAAGPWSRPASTFPATTIEQVLPHPERADDWLIHLSDGRLLRTLDAGATWLPANAGLEARHPWFMMRSPSHADVLLTATTPIADFSLDTVIYRSSDGGNTWAEWSNLGTDPVRQLTGDPRRPGRLYAVGFYGTIYWSDDDGLSWSTAESLPDPDGAEPPATSESLEPTMTIPCQFVRDLAASPHEDVLLAGCVRDSGAPVSPPIYHSDAFVSRDAGATWQTAIDIVGGRPGQDAWSFAFDALDPDRAYAGLASGEFFRSEDGGLSWNREADAGVVGLRDVASRGGEVLLATVTRGVLRRAEEGIWQEINEGLSTLHIRDLEYASTPGRVLAGTEGGGLYVLERTVQCVDDAGGSCMLDRFRVTAEWRDEHGTWHPAGAQRVAPGTSAFWFFDDRNLELAVKMIDGRGVNGHFWFYAGALSDVAYRIHVLDTMSVGPRSRTYSSQPGLISSLADIEAFHDTAPTSNNTVHSHPKQTRRTPTSTPTITTQIPLTPVPPSVQLGEYRLTIEWRLEDGPDGLGFGRTFNELSAAFWFFEPGSLDLFFKILDGRGINGHDWLFAGSLTDVGFTLHVTHEPSGWARSYENPVGDFAGFLDLELGPDG